MQWRAGRPGRAGTRCAGLTRKRLQAAPQFAAFGTARRTRVIIKCHRRIRKDSQGFTKSSRGYARIYGGFADGFAMDIRRIRGFADGFAMDRRRIHGFATNIQRIRGCSAGSQWIRGFTRIRESSREFARVREGFARVREGFADGFATDIRRIRGLTQIRKRIHGEFARVLTQCSRFTVANPSMAFNKSLVEQPGILRHGYRSRR